MSPSRRDVGASTSIQDVMASQGLILDVSMLCGMLPPRPKSQLPSWRHLQRQWHRKAETSLLSWCGQRAILSTTAPAAWSVRRRRNSTPLRQMVNFSYPIHTPRNSYPQPKPAVIFPFPEAMVKGHKLPAYLHRPVRDEF